MRTDGGVHHGTIHDDDDGAVDGPGDGDVDDDANVGDDVGDRDGGRDAYVFRCAGGDAQTFRY